MEQMKRALRLAHALFLAALVLWLVIGGVMYASFLGLLK